MVSGVCLVVSGVCLVLSSVCLVVSGPYSRTCVHVVSENEGPIIETNIRICNEIFGSAMPPLPPSPPPQNKYRSLKLAPNNLNLASLLHLSLKVGVIILFVEVQKVGEFSTVRHVKMVAISCS